MPANYAVDRLRPSSTDVLVKLLATVLESEDDRALFEVKFVAKGQVCAAR